MEVCAAHALSEEIPLILPLTLRLMDPLEASTQLCPCEERTDPLSHHEREDSLSPLCSSCSL